jgi:hypothetical protein
MGESAHLQMRRMPARRQRKPGDPSRRGETRAHQKEGPGLRLRRLPAPSRVKEKSAARMWLHRLPDGVVDVGEPALPSCGAPTDRHSAADPVRATNHHPSHQTRRATTVGAGDLQRVANPGSEAVTSGSDRTSGVAAPPNPPGDAAGPTGRTSPLSEGASPEGPSGRQRVSAASCQTGGYRGAQTRHGTWPCPLPAKPGCTAPPEGAPLKPPRG